MILNELKTYIKSRQQVSLKDISIHFDIEPEAVKGLLDFWIKKGRISLLPPTVDCSGGCSCDQMDSSDLYQWKAQFRNISIDINDYENNIQSVSEKCFNH